MCVLGGKATQRVAWVGMLKVRKSHLPLANVFKRTGWKVRTLTFAFGKCV